MKRTISCRDIAADLVEEFESILDARDITVPSPEDDEKDPDNEARLYGSTFWDLVDRFDNNIAAVVNDTQIGKEADVDSATSDMIDAINELLNRYDIVVDSLDGLRESYEETMTAVVKAVKDGAEIVYDTLGAAD